MKITIDLENLETMVSDTLSANIENVIKEEVDKIVLSSISKQAKSVIEEAANKNLEAYINDYIKQATITTGGGLFSCEPEQVYTVEQYLRKELASILESKTFTTRVKDRYGDYQKDTVTFEDFVKQSFDYSTEIRKKLEEFAENLKMEINANIKNTFTETTKSALSESVFNVLMQSETYRKITDNIKYLSEK